MDSIPSLVFDGNTPISLFIIVKHNVMPAAGRDAFQMVFRISALSALSVEKTSHDKGAMRITMLKADHHLVAHLWDCHPTAVA